MKKEILDELIHKMKSELSTLESASKSSRDFATDQEFKAESKYDTRALEASYLASAEAKRVEDLKLEIQMLEEVDLDLASKSKEVCIGSLVQLKYLEHEKSYFLIPTSGGTLLSINKTPVLVVSVFSPLGSGLLGLKVGEEFEVETPKENRIYQVISFE